jgi:hypothetical protein
MRARKKLFSLVFIGIASLDLTGCGGGGSGTQSPGPTPTQAIHNQWTWVGGANFPGQSGVYGAQGTAAATNTPGAREEAISWTDPSGNFWLFGGNGDDASASSSGSNLVVLGDYKNDLWKYSGGQWTWMGGSSLADQPAVYGTQGTPNQNNIPGPRYGGLSWTDPSGSLWLFGGGTYTVTGNLTVFGTTSFLNDLWKYSAGQWTWMGGSSTPNQPAAYGTRGVAAPNNIPGGRLRAVSWTDSSGNFWLFGGEAIDSTGTNGLINDLWKYSAGQWTWMGGSNMINQPGIYGAQGAAAPANIPGCREQAVSWTDSSGNFWLFGGDGYDSQGTYGYLNDLWRFSAGQWTWMGGSNLVYQAASYGTQGTAGPANTPGARTGGASWTDVSGNLWLFGGEAYNSTQGIYYLNDVWKYSAGQWAWMGGSNTINQDGIYGTEGTPATANVPGGRIHATGWADASGKLWLFGGSTPDPNPTLRSLGGQNYQNDLWTYQP